MIIKIAQYAVEDGLYKPVCVYNDIAIAAETLGCPEAYLKIYLDTSELVSNTPYKAMLNCVFLFEKHPEEKATAKPQPQEELKTEDCREKHIRKVREWQKQNPKSLSSYQAKYVANNKEKIAKRAKESYQKNKTQLKAKALARYYKEKENKSSKKITKQIDQKNPRQTPAK